MWRQVHTHRESSTNQTEKWVQYRPAYKKLVFRVWLKTWVYSLARNKRFLYIIYIGIKCMATISGVKFLELKNIWGSFSSISPFLQSGPVLYLCWVVSRSVCCFILYSTGLLRDLQNHLHTRIIDDCCYVRITLELDEGKKKEDRIPFWHLSRTKDW